MVLHNNKWDRRAKHKYLKKHGLSASDVNKKNEHDAHEQDGERDDQIVYEGRDEHDEHNSEALGQNDSGRESGGADSDSGTNEGAFMAPELPELDELDPKLQQLFLERKAEAGVHTKPREKNHTIEVADTAEFHKAAAGVERSKLNKAVQDRFGNSVAAKLRKNPLEFESDSDFDDFMDQLDDADDASKKPGLSDKVLSSTGKIEISQDKQEFLDNLIR